MIIEKLDDTCNGVDYHQAHWMWQLVMSTLHWLIKTENSK